MNGGTLIGTEVRENPDDESGIRGVAMELSVFLLMMEMLLINLISINYFCHRRFNRLITVLGLTGSTIVIFSGLKALLPDLGNGKTIFFGFIYLPVFFLLYKEKWIQMIMITFMCWNYTLAAFVLSGQIVRLADVPDQGLMHIIVQTIFYLVTIYQFFKWIVPKYSFVVQNLEQFDRGCTWFFGCSCVLNYVVVWMAHLAFFEGEGSLLRVLIILLFTVLGLITYLMLYRMMHDSFRIRQLELVSFQDSLTGLGNRERLINDLKQFLEGEKPFSILFMDLDCFKKINDRYGHVVGDQYLQHFADISARILGHTGEMYRLGGDEFVALCPGTLKNSIMERLRVCHGWDKGAPCPFNGVSIGGVECSIPFPELLDILHEVDQKMYEMKKKRWKVQNPDV